MSVTNSFSYGSGSGIGSGVAVRLTSVSFDCKKGVLVKADSANTSAIYVGNSGVRNAVGGFLSSTGFKLSASEATVFPVLRPDSLYVIADSGSQNVSFFAT
jgi:hypothetical protein